MVEIAMAIVKLVAHLINGMIFMLTLGPRAVDALSRRVWSKAERIDSGTHLESQALQLAFDIRGNALAVSNEQPTVRARFFTPGAGWGKAEVISGTCNDDNARNRVSHPRITFDNRGNAYAVWIQDLSYDEGHTQETWTNRYIAGAGWEQAQPFEHAPGETQPATIAHDTLGNALAVWVHQDNNVSTLWTKEYTIDTGWSNATSVTSVKGNAMIMQLTFNNNGNALALCRTDKEGKNPRGLYNIYAIYYTAAVGWGEATLISKVINSYHMQTLRFAFDAHGNAIVVWSHLEGTVHDEQVHIRAKRYSVNTGWERAVKIDPGVISRYSEHVSESVQPRIAFDARGNAIVVWTQVKDSSRSGVWTNRYTAGKGWNNAGPIAKTYGGHSNQQLAVDPRGNAMVIWGEKNGIGASYYTADVGWGAAQHLYPYRGDGYEAFNPQIVFDFEGNAMAIWSHQNLFYTTIWSIQYTAAKAWGKLTPVKRDYTNKANDPFIFLDSLGIAHVVWSQRDLESSDVHFWTSHSLKVKK